MRRLLEADLKRVLVKLLPWILLVAWFVFDTVSIATSIGKAPDRSFSVLSKLVGLHSFAMKIIGFAALLGIYADEFKSMVMIGVIGRGLSRDKFVIGKFLDLCVLTVLMEVITIIYVFILKAAFGATFAPIETRFLIVLFIIEFLQTIAYVTIAAFFYFLSENAAIGLFAYLTFQIIIPLSLELILQMTNLAKYHAERYYVDGMMSVAASDFIMGDFVGGIGYVLEAILIYIIGATGITMLIFRRKELEF
ncbi:hypothetical protein [Butyrivibrio sp. FCS006]|uniref:hypothetical protein n=1 Tax=Butyrivibrio sp. FCS006 TaxID=1280684 RepID=UPI000411B575|nr:hypothetical protein [Butyrivibrio sp. FCS006]